MRALVIDEATCKAVHCVRAHAEKPENYYRPNTAAKPPGDTNLFVAHIEQGYRCVFSITENNTGVWRHLSVSVDAAPLGKFPSPEAIFTIAELFGFTGWDGNLANLVPPKDWGMMIHRSDPCHITVVQRLP